MTKQRSDFLRRSSDMQKSIDQCDHLRKTVKFKRTSVDSYDAIHEATGFLLAHVTWPLGASSWFAYAPASVSENAKAFHRGRCYVKAPGTTKVQALSSLCRRLSRGYV